MLHVTLDDGERNVLTLASVQALLGLVEQAESDPEIGVVLLEGNDRALTVGLDTDTVLGGGDEARRLLAGMGAVLRLLYLSRLRSVVLAGGHATAAGAMLLLVADRRIGYGTAGKIGLSEVRVGLEVPAATRQLVRDRVAAAHQYASTALARLYDHETASRIGFLDVNVLDRQEAFRRAMDEAEALAGLDERAYLATKLGMRREYRHLVGDD